MTVTTRGIDLPGGWFWTPADFGKGLLLRPDRLFVCVMTERDAQDLAAALQQQQPQAPASGGGWQPDLATVPKDGSLILVDTDGDGPMTAYWSKEFDMLLDCIDGAPFHPNPGGWCRVTRWMLIPAAPTPDQGSER